MEHPKLELPNPHNTRLAIVIAVVTVFSALVSWQSEILDHTRIDEDLDGLLASVNRQETLVLDQITAYDDLAAYTRWWQYSALAEAASAEMRTADSDYEEVLEAELRQYRELAADNKKLFPSRYLTADNRYDLDRQLGEMWADAADEKDLDPHAHFEESDDLIKRSLNTLGAGAVLSVGLIFFALVESLRLNSRHSRWLLAIGGLLSAVGVVLALLIQLDLV
jgi:hypothetical protein